MVPLFAAVIIAGLGIGALLSAFAARRAPAPVATSSPLVVVHTPTPAANVVARRATEAPTELATAAPASPSEPPSASPAPLPSPTTAPPTPHPRPTPSSKKAVTATPRAVVVEHTTVPPQHVATPEVAAVSDEAATSLVRGYLEAVAHGDDAAARSALGGDASPQDVQYLDPSLRITSLSAARKGPITRVEVEFSTARGQYFGVFNVDKSGTRITQHEIIPVGGTTAR
jgi:hypothetical protein